MLPLHNWGASPALTEPFLLSPKQRVIELALLISIGALAAWNFLFFNAPLSLLGIGLFYAYLCCVPSTARRPFWKGYTFGMGFFTMGLYWISYSLHVDLSRFWWLLPFSIIGIPLILSVFTGLMTLALTRFTYVLSWYHPLTFAAWWTVGEWTRGHVLTGFPWNLVGYVAFDLGLPFAQFAAYLGVYGLSFLLIAGSAFLIKGLMLTVFKPRKAGLILLSTTLAVGGMLYGVGAYRLHLFPTLFTPTQLKLVQPNIDQKKKWHFEATHEIFLMHLDLSKTAPEAVQADLIIWPESACSWYPQYLQNDPRRRELLASLVKPGGFVITGTPRITLDAQGEHVFNSLLVIDHTSTVVESFDKFHLAPFGEYLPLRDALEFLFPHVIFHKITAGERDFTPGSGPRTLTLKGHPSFSPLICYEAIFPHAVINSSEKPRWLLNITNDAWFGDSPGPYQHFHIARMRSIEEGLPLIRVANSGISAVIDPMGRLLETLPLNRAGVINSLLPQALPTAPFYHQTGDLPILGTCFFLILLSIMSRRRGARGVKKQ